ncbi:MAG: CDP-2,3-bis-(O-geranylgeranyl)-sn-glycerol synthase [Candidatus Micrarchaeota archaeon]|nr:CDP-2,3-bis-(O-geranylgeranyl)-sn-glycerol synthase [Candidatus Micrarchaeota archaeon]
MLDLYSVILYPLIFILPAYVSNGAPVLFGGGRPIDGGRKLLGKRIFGDNKTIRGLIAGLLVGSLIGFGESTVLPYMLVVGIAGSFGAHFGDLLGSFIKRRLGMSSGHNMGIMDQYFFVIFAITFTAPFGNLPNIYGIIFILIITGALHLFTNSVAHRWKLKAVPW